MVLVVLALMKVYLLFIIYFLNYTLDPTNSAAQLAQNAIRIANIGRATPNTSVAVSTYEVPPRQCISTPFGYLPVYGKNIYLDMS